MTEEWPAWRLWEAGKATLTELEQMSLHDCMKANEVLDAVNEARSRQNPTK